MEQPENATTDSPWPLANNPCAKYNDRNRDDCNLNLPLWQLVRASTAAPVYFPPEVVPIGEHGFVFVNGGITTYNNPAFLAFLMTTVDAYWVNRPPEVTWPAATGTDKLLVVSVGTGAAADANAEFAPDEMNVLSDAGRIPSALMYAALTEQDVLCRVFGDCLLGDVIESELNDLIGQGGPDAFPPRSMRPATGSPSWTLSGKWRQLHPSDDHGRRAAVARRARLLTGREVDPAIRTCAAARDPAAAHRAVAEGQGADRQAFRLRGKLHAEPQLDRGHARSQSPR